MSGTGPHTALTFLYADVLGLNVGALPFPEPPRLLDRLRRACRVRQLAPTTEHCYATWAARFIRFHGLRHPNTMVYTHLARQGPASVTSPLDVLGEVSAADVQAALEATRRLEMS